ncbi:MULTISPECIES: DPP IV N-terminal domain-containing protein [unclassified Colwellia]|uniref:S9 family peptidase n=1 Tax=unclassified Colwellia TaxID=196834 RepID=UPI0015F5E510|nr:MULTISPECIES: DPP IV N-terminal domain-containing protein [unclassified Colwellia]MBA6363763.1 DPP IV N-terminal domain-containing protein [Colwellia sp. BRX8-8]MBA6347918.1 DPP IV N-terminal domain-containing protein [Colwellia sp. BRX8-9]MBA6369971.1 DPP IV N-terminal domain-containing protein [Colwellia sp. BRX8-4]MBA6378665.1 DPP IV N-terminal domain-containing protein [Colwellia sp. BRX10-7]MBA6385857.1 DPP IV N-terminal domain-containing protein [Colwellia sp. BRX10-2]
MRKSLILASGVAIISALTPTLLSAKQLSVDDYKKAEQQLSSYTSKLVTGTVDYPLWSSNDTLVYRSHTEDGDKFFKVDINSQKKSLAFDHKKLAESLARITDSEVNHDKFPFTQVEFISANNIKFSVKAKSYQCDLTHYLCQLDELSQKSAENLSPDGKRAVFIRDHNLWLRDLITDKESQLTTDGIKDFGYATNNAGWVRRDSPVVTWAPDSKKLTTFKHDGRNVGDMGIVSTAVGHPTIDVWKYPLPGDEHIFAIHRVVIDVESKKVTPLDMAPDAHRSTITDHVAGRNGELLDIDWADDSKTFAFVSSTRDHKTATLKIADAKTGKVKLVMSETQKSFFESGVDGISWQYLEKSNEAIWFSQRSNWGHLYLIDLATGKVKQQITQGDWTVIELLHVDQQTGKLIFTGAGKEGSDPYYHYLYSVNKDGSELTLLTPEKKHHRITLNKAGTHFLDRAATPTTAEISRVRAVSNNKELTIETMDISQLKASGWQAPVEFIVKDRNGENDIYGLMYKPTNFDASQSYPVVNYLYPGPQVGSIRGRHFRSSRGDNQAIAELGFIVIEIDALGTPGRSKAFHEFYYGNMGDSGIPDQVSAIEQLAKRHNWIDVTRVGIWGHSGGGFASTRALLTFPNFYKVAVSQAGNHDNRNYADEWGEKYHGLEVIDEEGISNYDSQANQLSVDSLQGKLLIAHGTTDTNVPPYNTLIVVEALIKANKDFDMLMLPNRGHGFAREPYMMRKRWDYFVEHLMGATPPKEFQFSK